ncbi:MAG: phenylacetate-CoA oxygenase subunit PaaJ [Saprospiraceae bacterium]|nr:phenylacetate-CoA oxygenase subunit PaaJ [Saprospiraceae bacterium]MCB9327740.1 phenylacetate-CoA oxygenase subunit PaaJ [Lewinellaceae bacterium]
MQELSLMDIKSILEQVKDPEIPVLSIIDMGVVRHINIIDSNNIEITITPTYTGCPAMDMISVAIKSVLIDHGFRNVEVKQILQPAWTTDWITEKGRSALKEYGIAPPVTAASKWELMGDEQIAIPCPRCNSENTEMISFHGSTACKSMYRCKDCLEPFDYFKCH